MNKRQSRMLILPGAWRPRRGPAKNKPDTLYNEVEKLSSRVNADRVMNEAFQNCYLEEFDCNIINKQIDEALIKEAERLKGEQDEQLSCVANQQQEG